MELIAARFKDELTLEPSGHFSLLMLAGEEFILEARPFKAL